MGTLQENRTLDYEEEKNKRIRILEERLEEYQKYIDINHKEIERLNNIINRTTKYVESLSSKGRGCDIYEDIKQEILKELKGSDK